MLEELDDDSGGSPVVQFFKDRSIFITGATGFMGKVLVEKLLRSTSLKRIYILIRCKKGVATEQRLEELLRSKVFDRLRESKPEALDKVSCVAGDITQPHLGISEVDSLILEAEVSVVFHSAATVRFDDALTDSVSMNVGAVLAIINLCKNIVNLKALVHVSTAYCNCDLKQIQEVIYPSPADPMSFLTLCRTIDSEVLNSPEVTRKLIGGRPNTYTFTKALAENLLLTEGKDLPVAIVRPSIVTAAWAEPVPGWVDNLNGATGLIAGGCKGVLRTICCRKESIVDFIPVDVAINLLCCAAWRAATRKSPSLQVYNCTSGAIKPFRWKYIESLGMASWERFPPAQLYWYPGGSLKESAVVDGVYRIFVHWLPAYLADCLAWLTGHKPVMIPIIRRMHNALKTLEFFMVNEWTWTNMNTLTLYKEITTEDRMIFNFNLKELSWAEYLDNYVKGVNRFVFKEEPYNLADNRRRQRRMYWLHLLFRLSLPVCGLWLLYALKFDPLMKFIQTILHLAAELFNRIF